LITYNKTHFCLQFMAPHGASKAVSSGSTAASFEALQKQVNQLVSLITYNPKVTFCTKFHFKLIIVYAFRLSSSEMLFHLFLLSLPVL